MDIPTFQRKVAEAQPLHPQRVQKIYGDYEEARGLFNEKEMGTAFLDEYIHSFRLQNGAILSVDASPYTPSLGDWGFQYHPNRYGAELVRWRQEIRPEPSHLTHIDNKQSLLVSRLATFKGKGDPQSALAQPLERDSETLSINAAFEGSQDLSIQPPWLVDLDLPAVVWEANFTLAIHY
ncbi:hypothetical protein N7491_004466 [Penicillium cf. griseofulvum]|uniref:Uncharacterized protein n=1 Tax=Penicillium cf. griseofulvum TaxID=2972120 RepID=A0A9W9M3C7_9EURO|nr:hypothetical protein N7472_007155 [Penicillium cf. griseofulvum]KAJ5422912.1 hypothetical protein N7445_011020 [Penicillium cf. griseofulvum]KAJ5433871.1 hypothetical protein N7491_004466 [Penicillium cf. griseofulvum]